MSKSILIIADEQDNDVFSLEKARDIFKPLDGKLSVARFLSHLDPKHAIEQKALIEQAEIRLQETISEVFDASTEVDSHVVATKFIADWVQGTASENSYDLVVKTGHRTENIFHTPTDWELMRQLPCPIFIANDQKWNSKPVVLTCVDLSTSEEQHLALNEEALKWTALWCKAFSCSCHIVYSIPIAKVLVELNVIERSEYLEKHRPEAQAKLDKLLEKFEIADVKTHVEAGPPEKTIPHVASEVKADLVIMGTVGRTGLKGFLFGNTAEKVLHKLRTDTLIVEAKG